MQKQNSTVSDPRLDVLIGTLIYMMTVYHRSQRRDVALSIAAHLDRLAQHPDADDTVKRVATGMRSEWERTVPAAERMPQGALVH